MISNQMAEIKAKHTKERIIEFERVQSFCGREREKTNRCGECRTETDFVPAPEAAQRIQTNSQTIFRLTEAGVLHSLLAANGELYVCLDSLMSFKKNRFC